jgi:group I intron endonuclease
MVHYVYLTTNLINGKQYIGDHSTHNLDDGYLGSGKLIRRSLKKYGKENFKKEILEHCETKELAFNNQEKYINQYNTLHPNGYNINPIGGFNKMDEKTRKKISKSRKGIKFTKEHIKKLSKSHKGISQTEESKKKISESLKGRSTSTGMLGKEHSLETKQKMSESAKKRGISKETQKKMLEGRKNSTKIKGQKRSEETKRKMREAWIKRKQKEL